MKRSLEFQGRRFAKLNAIARSRSVKLPTGIIGFAYNAFVSGDIDTLKKQVTKAARTLDIEPKEIHKVWRKLDANAKRETSRYAFKF